MASVSEQARQVISECEEQLNSSEHSSAVYKSYEQDLNSFVAPRPEENTFEEMNTELQRRHRIIASDISNHSTRLLQYIDTSYNRLYADYCETLIKKNSDLLEENKKLKERLDAISRAMSE